MDGVAAPKRQRIVTKTVAEKAAEYLKIIRKRNQNYHPEDKENLLLRLFIEFAQKGQNECSYERSQRLKDWISESKIDVKQKDWIEKYEDKVNDMDWDSSKMKPVLLAYILRDLLPILFKCNDDVTYTDDDGKTILHLFLEAFICNLNFCSEEVQLKIPLVTKKLIDMGASVNLADKKGITPLHIAIKHHHRKLIDMMLKSFTNVHSCDENGNTILHYAVEKFVDSDRIPVRKFDDIVCILLTKGADMHRKNKDGMTPVHLAAKYSNVYVLEIFLDCGADIDMPANNGDTALLITCKNLQLHDHDGIRGGTIELLTKRGCDVNVTDAEGYSALHFLASYASEILDMVVKRGANVRCRTKEFGLTPLHFASDAKTMEILIEAGAEVDAKTVDGVTPLLMAVMNYTHDNVLDYLIKRGADIKVRDKLFGFTILHFAALHDYEDKVVCLLGRGFNVNDGGKFDITPLHLAALMGRHEIVRVLIENGVDGNCRDKITGSIPLHFASMKANEDMVEGVISRIAPGKAGVEIRKSWKVPKLWRPEHDEVMEMLLKNGADKTIKNSEGKLAFQG